MSQWGALGAWAQGADSDTRHYVLVRSETGCIHGIGSEGSIYAEPWGAGAPIETRSRYNEYFLDEAQYLALELESDQTRPLLLVALSFVVSDLLRQGPSDGTGLLNGSTVAATPAGFVLEYEGNRIANLTDSWRIQFNYTSVQDPQGRFPNRIDWTRIKHGTSTQSGWLALEEASAELSDLTIRYCVHENAWSARLAVRPLTDKDVPAPEAIPKQYPMRQAYWDSKNTSEVAAFFGAHPDARLMGMRSSSGAYALSNPLATVQSYIWHVTFASPLDQVKIELRLTRKGIDDVPAGADPNYLVLETDVPIKPGFGINSIISSMPLIPLSDILGLAAQAGLESPTRVGWGEPPYWNNHHPHWYVADQDDNYGTGDPNAHRLYYRFNADTGWLTHASYDIPVG